LNNWDQIYIFDSISSWFNILDLVNDLEISR